MSKIITGVVTNGVIVPKVRLAEGTLVEIHPITADGQRSNPLLHYGGHTDPNDPLEKEFDEEMARLKREDYERTMREYEEEPKFASALDFLESLPSGPFAFKTWDEYERFLLEERNSWDR